MFGRKSKPEEPELRIPRPGESAEEAADDPEPPEAGEDRRPSQAELEGSGDEDESDEFDEDHDKLDDAETTKNIAMQKSRTVVTRKMFEEYLVIQRGLKENCATIPFTFCFWINFIIITITHGFIFESYEVHRTVIEQVTMAEAMTSPANVSASTSSDVLSQTTVNIESISDFTEFWLWMKQGFIPIISDPMGNKPKVASMNHVLPFARIIQYRHPEGVCSVGEEVQKLYGSPCYPSPESIWNLLYPRPVVEAYGKRLAPLDQAFEPDESERFIAWLDVGSPTEKVQERVEFLWEHDWIDFSSSALEIQACMFNAEVGLYVLLSIEIGLPRGGEINPIMRVRTIPAKVYSNWSSAIPDAIWLFLISALFLQELKQLLAERSKGRLRDYWSDYWNWVDWTSIIMGSLIVTYWLYLMWEADDLSHRLTTPGSVPKPKKMTWEAEDFTGGIALEEDTKAWEAQENIVLDHFERLQVERMYQRLALFWYTLIILLRFLKGFRGQPRVALIAETLKFASIDLFHFMLIFMAVFLSFALGGHVLFGPHLLEWSTFVLSTTTSFRLLMGSSADYLRLYTVAPAVAASWFWSYMLFVVMVMLNLLVALIIDQYAEVKRRMGEDGQSIVEQLQETYSDFMWSMGYDGTARNPTLDELLDLFSDHADEVRDLTMFEIKLRGREVSGHGAEPVTVKKLTELGVQKGYAKRLMNDCRSKLLTEHKAPTDPVDMIAREMEQSFSTLSLPLGKMGPRLANGMGRVHEVLGELEEIQNDIVPTIAQVRQMTILPPEWTMQVDKTTGREFFTHKHTGVSSWDVPKDFASAAIFQRFLVKKKNFDEAASMLNNAIKQGRTKKNVEKFKDNMVAVVKQESKDGPAEE